MLRSWWLQRGSRLRRLLHDPRGEMAEAAVTLPIVMLAALAIVNLTIAGFASVNAANAANYGARIGSVNQENPSGAAVAAANQMLANTPIGDYIASASGGGPPGSLLAVTVSWEVPNYFKGLMSFFGASLDDFSGTTVAYFRQEGW
jgi:hypothetical protein